MPTTRPFTPPAADAAEPETHYRIGKWGRGYFGAAPDGRLTVHPEGSPGEGIALTEIVDGLRARELHPPVLLRFSGILEHRMRHFRATFDRVIEDAGYGGRYTLVYPIKVNQQRHMCEEIRDLGRELGFGLEVGSKPELLAALSLTTSAGSMPIVCNGFKDEEYLTLVTLASKLGRAIVPVVERMRELEILADLVDAHRHPARLGVRVRLDSAGVGRWESSSGTRGKFGLSISEALRALDILRARGHLDRLHVLHCHVGSQLHDIRAVKRAVTEMARLYVELRRQGAPIRTVDLGGGLAVDYDGSRSARDSSMNYDLEEYAEDIVYRLRDLCDEAGVPHPEIVTESGRAVAAYSSVLVVDVVGVRTLRSNGGEAGSDVPGGTSSPTERDLREALQQAREPDGDIVAAYHDAEHARDEAAALFALGEMSLPARVRCEDLFWTVATSVLERAPRPLPEELTTLPERMADLLFCNFSLFQSLPDVWAIDQVFPIVPLRRLNEPPDRLAVLADITCDSDGKVDRFVGGAHGSRVLSVHALDGDPEPYPLGIFLVGAYQETLGDLHNLLGDTHAIHIASEPGGGWRIEEVVEGDSVKEVLGYVQFEPDEMRRAIRRDVERAIRGERLDVEEATAFRRLYEKGLEGYTYLDE